jgi:cysteine desulfurase
MGLAILSSEANRQVSFVIYLDNSATTRPDPQVIETVQRAMEQYYGNPSSLHKLGVEAENVLKQARIVAAEALQIKPAEVIFTSGGTESNNLALKGVAFQYQSRGKHIITTQVEHPCVFDVCRQLEANGFSVTYLPVDEEGRVRLEDLQKAIRNDTILVSVMHVNNEIGTIQPIAEIGEVLKAYPKILFHVDAVQSFGKVPIRMKEWGIDLLSVSAHKFHGPRGVGLLAKREGVSLHPLLVGGGQEGGIRSGTENVPGIAGMARAIRLLEGKQAAEQERLRVMTQRLREGIERLPGCVLNSPRDGVAPHIVNFSVPGLKAEVLLHALEEKGFLVSTKSACSSKKNEPSRVIMAMGAGRERALSAIRVSVGRFNEAGDTERFLVALEQTLSEYSQYLQV